MSQPNAQYQSTLETTFRLYRENLSTFALISALVFIPAALIEIPFQRVGQEHDGVIGMLLALVPMVPVMAAFFMQSAAIDIAAAQVVLGTKPTVGSAYSGVLNKLSSMIAVSIYYAIVVVGGFVLFVVPGFIMMAKYAYALPAVVIEGKTAEEGMRRSSDLTEGRKWHIFALYFLMGIVTSIMQKFGTMMFGHVAVPILGDVLRTIPGILIAPLMPIAITLDFLSARALKDAPPSDVPLA